MEVSVKNAFFTRIFVPKAQILQDTEKMEVI